MLPKMIVFKCLYAGKTVIVNPYDCEFVMDAEYATVLTKAGNKYSLASTELAELLSMEAGAGVYLVSVKVHPVVKEEVKSNE